MHLRSRPTAELERRRTIVMEPEEAILTELQMTMLFAEYEILPCRKRTQGYGHTLKELMIKVDTAIKEGRTTPHKVYNAKWLKYRGYMLVKNVMKARVKMLASQRWANAGRPSCGGPGAPIRRS